MRGSVTVHMAAPADEIWVLVSDVTQIGKYSPETFEAEWLNGATGPAVGARFRGHVKRNGRGPVYWTTCNVTASTPGREFAFTVGPANNWIKQLGLQAGPDRERNRRHRVLPTGGQASDTRLLGASRVGAFQDQRQGHASDTRANPRCRRGADRRVNS